MTDSYWVTYDRCLDRIRTEARTVDDLMSIVNEHFPPSVAEAFFPGGSDRSLLGTLLETPGWTTAWVKADYFFAARDHNGDGITYVEGDIYRGIDK